VSAPDDIAALAKSLTEAQRRAVAGLSGEWTLRTEKGTGAFRVLYARGIAEWDRRPDVHPEGRIPLRRVGILHRLTPLGLAVRQHLERTK
jgi:hypothetical protein